MTANPYSNYLEATVLSADPIELIRILYRTAIESVHQARGFLAEGEIAGRVRAVNKAWGALRELSFCLNHDVDPGLSQQLAELYDYMQRRLLTANFEQTEAPLIEVAGLLEKLSEAWEKVEAPATSQWSGAYTTESMADRAECVAVEF